MYETINEQLRNHFYQNPGIAQLLAENETEVLANRRTSFAAAAQVLQHYFNSLSNKK